MTVLAESGTDDEGVDMKNALRWIGELDHPFYDDERQRFIWYEASTIAFQVFVFANIGLAGAMLWIGGAEAVPYALAVFLVQTIGVSLAVWYATSNYAEYVPKPGEVMSGRNMLYFAFVIFAGGGFVRALLDFEGGGDGAPDSFFGGAAQGAIFGIIAVPFIVGFVIAYKRRHVVKEEDLDEF